MRRIAIIASLLASVGISSTAQAGYKADVRASAKQVRKAVDKRFGRDVGGRNIAARGVIVHGKRRPATLRELLHYRSTLLSMLHPVELTAPAQTSAAPNPETAVSGYAASSSATGSSAGLPACASESGTNYSTGPDNTNPSGATGRYQEMPEHRQKGGLCYGIDLSPSGQDECAKKIYAAQGAGAWVGCG